MLDHRFGASKWAVKSPILIVAASTRLVLAGESKQAFRIMGDRSGRRQPRDCLQCQGSELGGANCHPFQRIAFRGTDIFVD